MITFKLTDLLNEDDRLGFAGRLDATGIRGQGLKRDPLSRDKDYPYDKEITYGQPNGYDRGSTGHGGLTRSFTPKNVEQLSDYILGMEDEPSSDPVDDESVDEAMGGEEFMSKGNSSQLGTTIPGATGGWSNSPKKDWDEEPEISDEPKEVDEGPLTIDPRPPDIEMTPNAHVPDHRDQTDDDLENRMNRIFGREDNENFFAPKQDVHVVGSPQFLGMNPKMSSRFAFMMIPKESAWDRVEKLTPRSNYSTRKKL